MYEIKNFDHLIGLPGFSDTLLKNHFTLYQGYVNNFNKLDAALMAMEKEGKFGTQEFAELNRRLGWEWNGMRLHELYFSNLIPRSLYKSEGRKLGEQFELYKKILAEWDSFDLWEKDFRAMAAMRGIGWVILYYDAEQKRLFNVWINEHDVAHLAGARPLLVIDVFEHAYMLDYGLKRTDYIEAFMKAIDWEAVEKRF